MPHLAQDIQIKERIAEGRLGIFLNFSRQLQDVFGALPIRHPVHNQSPGRRHPLRRILAQGLQLRPCLLAHSRLRQRQADAGQLHLIGPIVRLQLDRLHPMFARVRRLSPRFGQSRGHRMKRSRSGRLRHLSQRSFGRAQILELHRALRERDLVLHRLGI